MALTAGTRLGPYEIVAPIGKGGMGEVYRARDTKLDREVAIKVLPEELAADKERVARFEREAKLLASLNHPNIASIYGFESNALVLELVEGPTLAERIERGPIPIDETLAIAKQIADALEAGHEAGVVHRDLKPANVKLKEDCTVKVLDYGLAKALESDAPSGGDTELSQSPTLTRQGTQVGVILGTAPYMSPEQAKGKRVDKRADIWAFGAVLYEMLTGKQAFGGDDVSEILAAVIRAEPDFSNLPDETPAAIRRLLHRCLSKSRRDRLADIADARLELIEASSDSDEVRRDAVQLAFWQRPAWTIATGVALVALAALALTNHSEMGAIRAPVARYVVSLPENDLLKVGAGGLAVSPDGARLAYVAKRDGVKQLFVRERVRVDPRAIPGTEGADSPFFSPDGEWLGFYRENSMMKVALAGGAPERVTDWLNPRGVSWGPDNTIVFAVQGNGIFMVPASGGDPIALPDTAGALSPSFVQDGASVMFVANPYTDARSIIVRHLASGEERELIDGPDPRIVADFLVFVRETSLWAAPFDVERASIEGDAVPILDGLNVSQEGGFASYGLGTDGSLTYVPGESEGELVRVDPNGESTPLARLPSYHSMRLSPDGRKVAFDGTGTGIYVLDLASGARVPVSSRGCCASWSPDGSKITVAGDGIRIRNADGTGDERVFYEFEGKGDFALATSWSPDGAWIATTWGARRVDTNYDIWIFDPSGEHRPFTTNPGRDDGAVFSPDGEWIAYHSDQSGSFEVYVAPFRGPGERVAVSVGGGTSPLWHPNGSQLYYRHDTAVMAVSVTTEPTFSASAPRQVLDGPYWLDPTLHNSFGIFANGDLLMIDTGQANEINVVLNWVEELKRLVPTGN